jgi:small basic protein (TIGR04137 family)
MTMDRSLKNRGGLRGNRSVMTRAERIAKMTEEGRFDEEDDSPFGLPKLRVRQSKAGSKSAKKEEAPVAEGAEGAEGAEAVEGEEKPVAKEGEKS